MERESRLSCQEAGYQPTNGDHLADCPATGHGRTNLVRLRAGAVAGVVAAAAGGIAHLAVVAATGREYPELTVLSVVLVALVALTIGGLVYALLAARLRRPELAFAILAATAVAAETAPASTREGGFLLVATVLHLVVAAIAVVLISRLFRSER